MFIKRQTVAFTTTAGGAATVYSDAINGELLSIRYKYGDADTGADFTITTEDTLQPIVTVTNAGTSSVQWQPRQSIHDSAASAIAAQYDKIALASERIKIVVAQGGATKSGTFEILIA
jgi:hypothetical protein